MYKRKVYLDSVRDIKIYCVHLECINGHRRRRHNAKLAIHYGNFVGASTTAKHSKIFMELKKCLVEFI